MTGPGTFFTASHVDPFDGKAEFSPQKKRLVVCGHAARATTGVPPVLGLVAANATATKTVNFIYTFHLRS
jgi:hypothetical protein